MNDYLKLKERVTQKKYHIKLSDNADTLPTGLSNEALFQLPLISMTILTLSSSRSKPKLSNIGQLVGDCFERTFDSFKGSLQHIGWSANLRVRTISALTFLEASELIEMKSGRIHSTQKGKKIINKTLKIDSNLSYTLSEIKREYLSNNRINNKTLELI